MSNVLNSLSGFYLPGVVAMWCALFFSLATLWGYSRVLRGDGGSLTFARRAYGFYALSIVLASVVLLVLLWLRDFRIEYVFKYSGTDIPVMYQLAAFWAGQKGSFLIWLLWGTLLGLLLRRAAGKAEAPVMAIYTLTLLGLLFILIWESPFTMLKEAHAEGEGLNPLLQSNWMVIHPPIMFVGYAASAIAYSFAMAGLWMRDTGDWARRAFPWALGGFLVLGFAILLGGYWAYETLGWGGFWGWDPVENASLIPFLFGTALIHGLHMERTKGRFRRINVVLAWLTYLSVLYGTFLTRSGVLADFSVHSFVDLGISGWLIFLMVIHIAIPVLLAPRLRQIKTEPNEDPILSRGTFLVLAAITILVATLVVTGGTSAPLLTKSSLVRTVFSLKSPAQVGPEWYNLVHLPIALLVSLLLALVPYLTWRGNPLREVLARMRWPIVAAAALTVAAAVWQVRNGFHLLFVFLATLALATNAQKTVGKFRAGGLRGAGGYLAHVGVGVILLGILASSAYDQSTKVVLTQGVPQKLDDMTMTFTRYIPREGRKKERMEIEVVKGGETFKVYPKLFMNQRTKQVMASPDIRNTLLGDLYVSPIEFDPGQPRLQLAKGESGTIGDLTIRFAGFNLQAEGNAMAQMAGGQQVTIGVDLAVAKEGTAESRLTPLYRLNPASGQVETPPVSLPGGGSLFVAGINPNDGSVQIETSGLQNPPKLAVDVSKKPLILLVWFGLGVVLAGGVMATINRLREMRIREALGQ